MNYPQSENIPSWSDLCELFQQAKSWEERYRQLLLLAKKLPPLSESQHRAEYEVQGCESRSWVYLHDEAIWLDSEARIIRGLMVVLLVVIHHHCIQDISTINIIERLETLGLRHYISDSRINGIQAIWQNINYLHTYERDIDPKVI
ncbi:SufE family protein [Celerinatantimonas yamalensis]|uniref:SufE family protein n=1 Tax=Celerinatantimonas yamalensis TaxID=559956 RepID=A0ABW9G5G7_9GAMM